jgi:hypothetical protein
VVLAVGVLIVQLERVQMAVVQRAVLGVLVAQVETGLLEETSRV